MSDIQDDLTQSPARQPHLAGQSDDRLSSWKEIAAHLGARRPDRAAVGTHTGLDREAGRIDEAAAIDRELSMLLAVADDDHDVKRRLAGRQDAVR